MAVFPRLQAVLLRLQPYIVILYRSSKMLLANTLLRLPNKSNDDTVPLNMRINNMGFSHNRLSQLRCETTAAHGLLLATV